MTELQVDEGTAAYVRAQARHGGVTESESLARHVRDAGLRQAAQFHAEWYAQRPGLLEDEVMAVHGAFEDADGA